MPNVSTTSATSPTSAGTGAGRAAGTGLVVTVVALQSVLHLGNTFTRQVSALDVHAERTVFSLLTAVVIGSLAVGCVRVRLRSTLPAPWALVLAGLLGCLAADELVSVHERAGERAAALLGLSVAWDSVLWPLLYLPLAGAVLVLLVLLVVAAPARVRRSVGWGLALLVTAVVLEVLAAPLSAPANVDGVLHALEGALEEGCELGGWGLLAAGVLGWRTDPAGSGS
jgi:xanthosine utilization system XapX-like protein